MDRRLWPHNAEVCVGVASIDNLIFVTVNNN